MDGGATMVEVGQESFLYGERVWFFDTRSPARRMAVSAHPDEGLFVISFWQGDACSGTFRLPLAEGASLISTLAHGMARGIPPVAQRTVRPSDQPAWWWRRWLQATARRLRPHRHGQRVQLHLVGGPPQVDEHR